MPNTLNIFFFAFLWKLNFSISITKRKKMSFEANAYSILAGSYERFLFGHTFSPAGFTTTLEDDKNNEEKKKEGDATKKTKFLCTIDAHQQSIKSLAAAGPFFCSGGHDDRIRAFHVNKRGEISDVGSLTGHTGTVTCIAFAKPGGGSFGAGIEDGKFNNNDSEKKNKKSNNNNNNNNDYIVEVPPPSRMLSGSEDGTILVWQTYDFEILKKMLAHRNGVSGLSVHASGLVAVSCGKEDRSVALWDLKKGRVAYKGKTRGGEESGIDVFFSSKEEDASGGGGGNRYGLLTNKWLDVIDCESGGEVSAFMREDQREGRIGYRKCLCATSKTDSAENIYRIGYEGGDVCIFDARVGGGSASTTIENAHENRVRCIAEIPERGGHTFATASSDGIIKVWDERSVREPIARVEGGGRYTSLVVMDNNDVMRRSKPAKPKEIEIDDIEARLEMRKKEEKKANAETQKKAEKGKKKKTKKKTKADYDKMDSDSELEIVDEDKNKNESVEVDDGDESDEENDEDDEDAIEKMRQAYNKTHQKNKSKRKPQQSRNSQYEKNATTARKKANKKSKSSNRKVV